MASEYLDEPHVPAGRTRARHGPLTLDLARREAVAFGVAVPLTRLEFELLHILIDAPGRAFSRAELMSRLHAIDGRSPTDRSLDSLIVRLRRKLRDDRRHPRLIQAVWGLGYRLVASPADAGVELAAQAIDLVPTPALLLDHQREIVAANGPARRLFGRVLEGRRCFDVLECRAGLRSLRDRCRGTEAIWGKEPFTSDYTVTTPAGPVRTRATYVPFGTGRLSLCLLVLTPLPQTA